jgi:Gpi18-like mannosyltransferase
VLRAAEKAKKKEVVVAAQLDLQRRAINKLEDLLKVISATLYILIYPEYISGLNRFNNQRRFSLKNKKYRLCYH